MAEYKTPGVYVVERNAFPNSVVQVPTDFPVFIGYTQRAANGAQNLENVLTEISGLLEFETYFGVSPAFDVFRDTSDNTLKSSAAQFMMHRAIRLFFQNGGMRCCVISVGGYVDDVGKAQRPNVEMLRLPLDSLQDAGGPSMIVMPDAAMLSLSDWAALSKATLEHCEKKRHRFAILDLVHGDMAAGMVNVPDPVKDFYASMADVNSATFSFGAAYYPWLNTMLIDANNMTADLLRDDLKAELQKQIEDEIDATETPDLHLRHVASNLTKTQDDDVMRQTHNALFIRCKVYHRVMTEVLEVVNLVPPSAAIAGVICAVDVSRGPWTAPANVQLQNVASPAVQINDDQQQELNTPVNGFSINAIRNFSGRGNLVWGARTLEGNSGEWRYIPVRRTLIMIEQSIVLACGAYVFEPNNAATWTTMKSMIANYLTSVWKGGGLAGASASDAFAVRIGLGETMTANDVLEGRLFVEVHVAVLRPAEFIVLRFTQKMAKS